MGRLPWINDAVSVDAAVKGNDDADDVGDDDDVGNDDGVGNDDDVVGDDDADGVGLVVDGGGGGGDDGDDDDDVDDDGLEVVKDADVAVKIATRSKNEVRFMQKGERIV